MPVDLDLSYTSASELARLIRTGALSPVEVIKNALNRIGDVNPTLNGFCFVFSEDALAEAKILEAEARQGQFRGPLHGVPVAIKDVTPTKGRRTTFGSYAYEHNVPDEDATIVEALKRAGCIMIGKTTTPEFACGSATESPLWGISRNPWDPNRTPGGSSGGSAIAVATGCVPLAEGSDMGGSVRIPASFCGIIGYKPSFGRIPFTILPSQFDQISHFGSLARTIEDSRLFLQVTQGPDERDIQSIKPALDFMNGGREGVAGLRIGLCLDFGNRIWDPEVERAVRQSAALLKEQGAEVIDVSLSWGGDLENAWAKHWCVYLATFYGHTIKEYRQKIDPRVLSYLERGLSMSAVEFKSIEIERTKAWLELAPILERCDALLCPTMAFPAVRVEGADNGEFWVTDQQGRYRGLDVTSVFNFVSQCPALSVPCGFAQNPPTAAGLPIGLQIVGRRFDDLMPLRIASVLEKEQPWAGRRPPI